jgi:hypothetical protein
MLESSSNPIEVLLAPEPEHVSVAWALPLQPEGQSLLQRLSSGDAPLGTEGIQLVALALGQIDDRAHDMTVIR